MPAALYFGAWLGFWSQTAIGKKLGSSSNAVAGVFASAAPAETVASSPPNALATKNRIRPTVAAAWKGDCLMFGFSVREVDRKITTAGLTNATYFRQIGRGRADGPIPLDRGERRRQDTTVARCVAVGRSRVRR